MSNGCFLLAIPTALCDTAKIVGWVRSKLQKAKRGRRKMGWTDRHPRLFISFNIVTVALIVTGLWLSLHPPKTTVAAVTPAPVQIPVAPPTPSTAPPTFQPPKGVSKPGHPHKPTAPDQALEDFCHTSQVVHNITQKVFDERKRADPSESNEDIACAADMELARQGWNCHTEITWIPQPVSMVGIYVGPDSSGNTFKDTEGYGWKYGIEVEGKNNHFEGTTKGGCGGDGLRMGQRQPGVR